MLFRLAVLAVVTVAAPLPVLALESPARDSIDALIEAQAKANKVPASLVHRVVKRESNYNPGAIGHGGALGLMQIKHATARGLGYKGSASGLLDAKTNLTYAVAYLAGAYRTAKGNEAQAYSYYARGYYYAAKRLGVATEVAEATDAAPAQPTGFAASPFGRFLARGFGLPAQPAQAPVAMASADAAATPVPVQPVVVASADAAATPVSAPLPPARPAALSNAGDPFAAVQGGTLSAPQAAPAPAMALAYAAPAPAAATPFAAASAQAAAAPAVEDEAAVSAPLPPRRPAALRHFVKKVAPPAAQTAAVVDPSAPAPVATP